MRRCILSLWALFVIILPLKAQNSYDGNLGITVYSPTEMLDAVPGTPITYTIRYYYRGYVAANNVVVKDIISPDITFKSSSIPFAEQHGDTLIWKPGNLEATADGEIVVEGTIKDGLAIGKQIDNIAIISGSVNEEDYDDNRSLSSVYVQSSNADLGIFSYANFETPEGKYAPAIEEGSNLTFYVHYSNNSGVDAQGVFVVDTLPSSLTYVSADPAPASVDGKIIKWNVGTLPYYQSGSVSLTVKPGTSGSLKNTFGIFSSTADRNGTDNSETVDFDVVPVLQPYVYTPSPDEESSSDTLFTGKNPKFQGFARAGATVSLYEVTPTDTSDPSSLSNPVLLGKAVAGIDRHWTITPLNMKNYRVYKVCLQAEYKGSLSTPASGNWDPMIVNVDPIMDSAGIDLNYFTITCGGQVYKPGAFGAVLGVLPYQEIVYSIREYVPDYVFADTSLWNNYAFRVVETINGETTEHILKPNQMKRTVVAAIAGTDPNDSPNTVAVTQVIFIDKGHGPGATTETWHYTQTINNGKLGSGTWRRVSVQVIDPAGFVYDLDMAKTKYNWPSVPPQSTLIKNATVTVFERGGDSTWTKWQAYKYYQVNPQVTDETTKDSVKVPGYYSFLVPPGQYYVHAEAPGYFETSSGVLTVINEPVFYNIGMHRAANPTTGVSNSNDNQTINQYRLNQNYPNPFNPATIISYELPLRSGVKLTVYNSLGQRVKELINAVQEKGRHEVVFNASSLSSGIYFYRIEAGNFVQTKKFVLMK